MGGPGSHGLAQAPRARWVLGVLALAAAGPLTAEPPRAAEAGDSVHAAAAAAPCQGCHGPASALGDLGQLARPDILAALRSYRSGERAGTLMPRIARGYSDAELIAMANALGRADDSPDAR